MDLNTNKNLLTMLIITLLLIINLSLIDSIFIMALSVVWGLNRFKALGSLTLELSLFGLLLFNYQYISLLIIFVGMCAFCCVIFTWISLGDSSISSARDDLKLCQFPVESEEGRVSALLAVRVKQRKV